jgi:excisionase family DNA binding protein
MIPPGMVSSHKNSKSGMNGFNRKSFSQIVQKGKEHEIVDYFNFIFSDSDDVLTTNQVAEMIGLDRSTIYKLASSGILKSIEQRPKYMIPKVYLLEFVVTRRFLEARSTSEQFIKLLGGFEIWQHVK